MRLRSPKYSAHHLPEATHFPWTKRLLSFAAILFFFSFADAIMTYFSPVYLESKLHHQFIMGLVIAFSSVIGLISDILFGSWYSNRRYRFFLIRAFLVGALFAASFLILPGSILPFIFSMALWGIAFEFTLFANYHFINEALDHPHHSIGWSVIKTFSAVAYMIGPLVSSFLLARQPLFAPTFALFVYFAGLGLFFLIGPLKSRPHHPPYSVPKSTILHEFKIWALLFPKLWPILLFVFTLTVLDASFWTVGSVLSETFKELHPFGGFLLTIYMVPSLFAGFIGVKIAGYLGKKRTAFWGGLFAGLFFFFSGYNQDIFSFLGLVFCASLFLSAVTPQIYAAIEDYIERLGHSSNALIGLENSTTSFAFIVGPIFAGALADHFGDQTTFSVVGAILAIVSILALLVVPKKIHLPQHDLAHLNQNQP